MSEDNGFFDKDLLEPAERITPFDLMVKQFSDNVKIMHSEEVEAYQLAMVNMSSIIENLRKASFLLTENIVRIERQEPESYNEIHGDKGDNLNRSYPVGSHTPYIVGGIHVYCGDILSTPDGVLGVIVEEFEYYSGGMDFELAGYKFITPNSEHMIRDDGKLAKTDFTVNDLTVVAPLETLYYSQRICQLEGDKKYLQLLVTEDKQRQGADF